MAFSHLDGDSVCGYTVYDPDKLAEYDSAHPHEKGNWVAGFDWNIRKAFLIDLDSYDATTKLYEKIVIIDSAFSIRTPLYGFYHFYDESTQTHHIVSSGQFFCVPRSYRIRVNDSDLNLLSKNSTIHFKKDKFFGLILHGAYFPGITKVVVIECGEKGECLLNYPEPTIYTTNKSFLSYGTFKLQLKIPAYDVFYFAEGPTYYKKFRELFYAMKNSLNTAIGNALFFGIELNEPLRAKDVLFNHKELSEQINAKMKGWRRPRFFARCIPGMYTLQELYFPYHIGLRLSTSLVGLMSEISYFSSTIRNMSLLVGQLYYTKLTYITNILMSPSHQVTMIAWGSIKYGSMFFYPGYPFFNSIIYDKEKQYELMTYINLPGVDPTKPLTYEEALKKQHSQAMVPYFVDAHKTDDFTDNPPVPSFSIFAEQYMMFEGLIMGRVRPKEIEWSDHGYFWYGQRSDIILKPIKLTVRKSTGVDRGCYPIDMNYTQDPVELTKFLAVNYSKSGNNPLLVFAEGEWTDRSLILTDLERPVLVALSAAPNPIDKLTDEVISLLTTTNENQRTSFTAKCYLLVQIAETKDFEDNPIKSLNGRHSYIQGYYSRRSEVHLTSSKYGVYNILSERDTLHEQILVEYTVRLDPIIVKNINGMKKLLVARNAQILSIEGNIIQGFTLTVNYPGSNEPSEERLDIDDDFTIEAGNLRIIYTDQYVGKAVFPHFLNIKDDLVWHNNREMIIYNIGDDVAQSNIGRPRRYPLPISQEVLPSILPPNTLSHIYNKLTSDSSDSSED